MAQLVAVLSLAVMASFLIGILLGRKSERDVLQERVDEAYNRAKLEAEEDKANFSLSLSEELTKVRLGIVQSVEAYDSVVRLVEERLPKPTSGGPLRIDDQHTGHLLIPFRGQGINPADDEVGSEVVDESLLAQDRDFVEPKAANS